MFRFAKKKTSRSLYWTIVFIFIVSVLTAFIYYFVLIEELEDKPKNIANNNIEKEINYRLSGLELGLKQNRDILKNIRFKLDRVIKDFNGNLNGDNVEEIDSSNYVRDKSICPIDSISRNGHKTDICMLEVYDELKFDNPDGGVWRQGWELIVNESNFNEEKLKIFVVPHSHNDPGWVKTFDRYFKEQTKNILDNAVIKLSENKNLKFIWAETSYLSAWWETVKDDNLKTQMRKLVNNGQLEIVTGGWVMNDEANVHYFALVTQMVEGHEWLMDHLDYRPKYGWAIDPFGLSPTMAYMLKQMGFEGMVIQRVHYSIKKYLAAKKQLEFRWRQYWESDNNNDIICHVQPFYSYDVPHTCGPDPKVCCQFDFKRLPPSRVKCPWKASPQKITDSNVHERSQLLLDQYRKKSMLYKTKSLLVPLGDDFRYDKSTEWDAQADNYQKLFNYINSRSDWNVEIKFSTLGEYFESFPEKNNFPTLSGDFFTYCDRDDHYWSGFYTSKPFFKRFERILESHLRSAEIIYSLASILNARSLERLNSLIPSLVYARQNLALFQHHDGITGTAKDIVVNDYANRMFRSLENLEKIIAQSITELMHYDSTETNQLKLVETLPNANSLPTKNVFVLNDENPIWYFVIYNSLGFASSQLICIHISTNSTKWCIKDNDGIQVDEIQVNHVWSMTKILNDRIEACFVTQLKALSLAEYSVGICDDKRVPIKTSEVTLYNFVDSFDSYSTHITSLFETPTEISLESEFIQLTFSGADGMLRKVIIKDSNKSIRDSDIRMKFMTYGTRSGKKVPKSGAYIFLPDNEDAQDLVYSKPKIRVTKGNIFNKFELILEKPIPIRHQISITKGKRYFEIENEFYLGQGSFGNKELMMRFYTDIQNEDTFYTDLNGFQMMKRKRYDKIPIQGNIYPMSTMAYIEDTQNRLNILTGQPLGTTSPRSGWIDVFLDRRLLQDDQRGLNQGVVDNRKTKEVFKILLERVPTEPLKLTLESQTELQKLLTPPIIMYSTMKSTISEIYFFHNSLPCNIHLMNLRRSSQPNEFSLFLHRLGISCESKCAINSSSVELTKNFSPIIIKSLQSRITQMSLSLLHEMRSDISITDRLQINEMNIVVYRLRTNV